MPSTVDPHQVFEAVDESLRTGNLELAPELVLAARQAAQRDPLADEYIVLAALEFRRQGQTQDAMQALELARQRAPRNRMVRALLVEAYLSESQGGKAAQEIAALNQMERGVQSTLLPVLEGLAFNPSTRVETFEALQGSTLLPLLIQRLARRRVSPELFLSLPLERAGDDMSEAERNWIASLVRPYVDRADYGAALQIWQHFYGLSAASSEGFADGNFSGYPGPPFGWQLDRPDGGIAEFSPQGLQVSHYGRSGWVIARQLLHLSPGRYRLRFETDASSADLPNLAWRIDCLESGQGLLSLPFNPETFLGTIPSDSFTVPEAGCPAQWLALAGRPEEPARTRSVTIRALELVPDVAE